MTRTNKSEVNAGELVTIATSHDLVQLGFPMHFQVMEMSYSDYVQLRY